MEYTLMLDMLLGSIEDRLREALINKEAASSVITRSTVQIDPYVRDVLKESAFIELLPKEAIAYIWPFEHTACSINFCYCDRLYFVEPGDVKYKSLFTVEYTIKNKYYFNKWRLCKRSIYTDFKVYMDFFQKCLFFDLVRDRI